MLDYQLLAQDVIDQFYVLDQANATGEEYEAIIIEAFQKVACEVKAKCYEIADPSQASPNASAVFLVALDTVRARIDDLDIGPTGLADKKTKVGYAKRVSATSLKPALDAAVSSPGAGGAAGGVLRFPTGQIFKEHKGGTKDVNL